MIQIWLNKIMYIIPLSISTAVVLSLQKKKLSILATEMKLSLKAVDDSN